MEDLTPQEAAALALFKELDAENQAYILELMNEL